MIIVICQRHRLLEAFQRLFCARVFIQNSRVPSRLREGVTNTVYQKNKISSLERSDIWLELIKAKLRLAQCSKTTGVSLYVDNIHIPGGDQTKTKLT
jgi:hypothetical protein